MGLFDSVYAGCPGCGAKVEFQSKADLCPYMNKYTAEDAPTHILIDLLNDPQYCLKCGAWLALIDPRFPPDPDEPARPEPVVVRLRDLSEGEYQAHHQGMRWWNAPFSYADIAQGIEAQRAETLGSVHESPTPKGMRPNHTAKSTVKEVK